jgi:hypothetical protein
MTTYRTRLQRRITRPSLAGGPADLRRLQLNSLMLYEVFYVKPTAAMMKRHTKTPSKDAK